MGELSTYSLDDFFPFTEGVYFRLFVRHNEAVWPWQIAAVLLAIAAIWWAWRGRGKPLAVILAAFWAFVGYTFHVDLYANLNWAAEYFGWAFVVQGVLVLVGGLLGRLDAQEAPIGVPEWTGVGMALFALVAFPLLGPLTEVGGVTEQAWRGAQLVGVAPDPTAIATFGMLLMLGRTRWWLFVIPVLWAAIAGATAWQMQDVLGFVTPIAALLALAMGAWRAITPDTSRRT